ncbi:hypothetical protein ABW365_11000 [Enterococcus avium]
MKSDLTIKEIKKGYSKKATFFSNACIVIKPLMIASSTRLMKATAN